LNNFEYAHWISFSIAALSVSSILRSIVAFISRKAQYLDFYILAFFVTYLALNLMGQTRGEVGRLWLFLNPSIALLAAHEVRFLFRKRKTGLCVGYLLPFVTTVLIFHFQDYW